MSDSILFDVNLREAVHTCFAKFIPLDVKLPVQGYREYYGYHEDFDEIIEGSPWPEYVCIVKEDIGTFTAKFEKI